MAGLDETTETIDGETLQVEADGGAESVLMSDSPTDSEWVATAADPSDEIMLLSAMGPSPWQNQDDPDDVNVDGLTTPCDALLVINRVNEGVLLAASAASEVAFFVDVNGDRSLDANDAVQVINTLNESDPAPFAADAASRVAPIWFDSGLDESAAWQDTVATEETDSTDLSDESVAPDSARMIARPVTDDEAPSDVSSEVEGKPDLASDDSLLFSEDADWLAPELL
jgi:hypothetical protein